MNALTDHEIAILRDIFQKHATTGCPVEEQKIIRELEHDGFDPIETALKILSLEKNCYIKIGKQWDSPEGYLLTNEAKDFVLSNENLFRRSQEKEIPF